MYEAFYGFSERPFSLLPDPSFLYLGKEHSQAFSMLEYGILHQDSFAVLTGEVGCGKTTLVRSLLNKIPDDICVGVLSNTHPDNGELLRWVLMAFGLDYREPSKVSLFDAFSSFLIEQYAKKRRTILIIDEAQNLKPPVLEELRMLSNINIDKHQVLQQILVGQTELRTTLQLPELRQFSQRISVDYHIPALQAKETREYIRYRIRHAGGEREIFTDEAASIIYLASKGIPRIINVLCDTALLYGFADQNDEIGPATILNVLKDRPKQNELREKPVQFLLKDKPINRSRTYFDKDMAKQLFGNIQDS
jgi:putative secretion ATPase (PEP-CTERM system associated)